MFLLGTLSSWEGLEIVTLSAGMVVIAAAVYACVRRVDVRVALFLGALALGMLAGMRDSVRLLLTGTTTAGQALETFAQQPMGILQTFLTTLANEKFVVPICCAMGFAHVLRYTQCDQHLVHLLVQPLRRRRSLLIPGSVIVGFLVNMPVISQTSTAVAIGSVIIPLLQAARISPVTSGAALLLGSSIGGELLNPGAPELRTVAEVLHKPAKEIVARILPLDLLQLGVATAVFWVLSIRAEARYEKESQAQPEDGERPPESPPFEVNLFKAVIPLVPLLILFAVGPPLEIFKIKQEWLVKSAAPDSDSPFSSRLIGAAMLVGVAAAALTTPKAILDTARVFFEGAGYAFTHIIALIVTASCFGRGVEGIGVAAVIGQLISLMPMLLLPAAGALPLAFAVLCGSGMASTQSLFKFFAEPAQSVNVDPLLVGSIVPLGSAAGRTMSPVAAVALMCAAMTNTSPIDLVKRVAVPLLVGMAAVVLAGMFMAAGQ